MEERMRFILRLLEGEEMSHVCREFGISRKTGYKIFDRYKDCGLEALTGISFRFRWRLLSSSSRRKGRTGCAQASGAAAFQGARAA